MNLRALDLNLLVVFDAVMEDRSVTKAAARLHMAQPALSHALGRLRQALGDELFIRTPEGMAPTPKAESLGDGVRAALNDLRMVLNSAEPFVPATAERRFAIAVNNHAALVLAAPLAAEVAGEAPGVLLDFRPSGTLDLADGLDPRSCGGGSGRIDDGDPRCAAPSRHHLDPRDRRICRRGAGSGGPVPPGRAARAAIGHAGRLAAIRHDRGDERARRPRIRAGSAACRHPPAVSLAAPHDRDAVAPPAHCGAVTSLAADVGAARRQGVGYGLPAGGVTMALSPFR